MYQELISQINSEVDSMNELINIVSAMPELEGLIRTQTHAPRTAILVFPYELSVYKRNVAAMLNAGWKQFGDLEACSHGDTAIATFYKGETRWTGIVISMHLDVTAEGSTCKRTLLGYEQRPVYEITCLEA